MTRLSNHDTGMAFQMRSIFVESWYIWSHIIYLITHDIFDHTTTTLFDISCLWNCTMTQCTKSNYIIPLSNWCDTLGNCIIILLTETCLTDMLPSFFLLWSFCKDSKTKLIPWKVVSSRIFSVQRNGLAIHTRPSVFCFDRFF